ncbi:MAG: hypothetical protein AAF799_06370 [Myxococcota bacterium]
MASVDLPHSLATAAVLAALCLPSAGCFPRCLGGCGDDSGDGGDDWNPDEEPDVGLESLDRCASHLSESERRERIAIVDDVVSSNRDLALLVGQVGTLSRGLTEGLYAMVLDPDHHALPEQFSSDGEGTYRYQADPSSPSSRFEAQFRTTRPFEFAPDGALLTQDLFDLETYLLDPRVVITDNSDGTRRVRLRHDGPGPLAELLGYGPQPPEVLTLDEGSDDWEDLGYELTELRVDAIVHHDAQPTVATVNSNVELSGIEADGLYSNTRRVPLDLELSAVRDDLEQELRVTEVDLKLTSGRTMDGELHVVVEGADFNFSAHLVYDRSSVPEITYDCE